MVKPFILNWAERNESCSFVSEIRNMAMFLSSIYPKESNLSISSFLALTEFMFTWPMISFLCERIFISLSPILAFK